MVVLSPLQRCIFCTNVILYQMTKRTSYKILGTHLDLFCLSVFLLMFLLMFWPIFFTFMVTNMVKTYKIKIGKTITSTSKSRLFWGNCFIDICRYFTCPSIRKIRTHRVHSVSGRIFVNVWYPWTYKIILAKSLAKNPIDRRGLSVGKVFSLCTNEGDNFPENLCRFQFTCILKQF